MCLQYNQAGSKAQELGDKAQVCFFPFLCRVGSYALFFLFVCMYLLLGVCC